MIRTPGDCRLAGVTFGFSKPKTTGRAGRKAALRGRETRAGERQGPVSDCRRPARQFRQHPALADVGFTKPPPGLEPGTQTPSKEGGSFQLSYGGRRVARTGANPPPPRFEVVGPGTRRQNWGARSVTSSHRRHPNRVGDRTPTIGGKLGLWTFRAAHGMNLPAHGCHRGRSVCCAVAHAVTQSDSGSEDRTPGSAGGFSQNSRG